MREIKFRGYSSEELIRESQWLEGYGVTTIKYTDNTETTHLFTPYGDYRVEKDSIGQYTGIKDKNGKEIYEGDIVKYFINENAVIIFRNGAFMIESKNDIVYICSLYREIEVIGNIYENEDLLEK